MPPLLQRPEPSDCIFTGRATRISRTQADDTPVIIKQLIGPHPRPEDIARQRREHALLLQVAGPNVVSVLELITIDGHPAIVEDDIGGASLAHHLKAWRPTLAEGLRLGVAVARGLQTVHAAGVIHKDVNPANVVWNRATDAVQLIDFGISSRVSRVAASSGAARLEGTLAYIAPEQTGRMNRPVDTRADLYALGVTLYEILAGHRPFVEDDPLELVHAHVARTPRPLSEVAPGVPEGVSAVIMRLLAKSAEDRYRSAAGVGADLERCLAQLDAGGAVEPFPLGARDVLRELRVPGRLYGRERERAALFQAFEQARGGGLEVVLVSGYSGVGKTTLIHELVRPVVGVRGFFVTGKLEQFNRGMPYASLLRAFGGFVRQLLSQQDAQVARWRERLLDALQGDGRLLTDVLPELRLVIGPQAPVEELPSAEAANRFHIVFRRFVRALASAEHPLVLSLDDLQWADLPTLGLLEALATDVEAGHLLVVGAYRNNEVDAAHPLRLTLQRIEAAGRRLRTIALRPLKRATVGRIVADAIGVPVGQAGGLADRVYGKTRGNPFFQARFLEALYVDGLLRFDEGAGVWTWDADEIERREITENVVEFLSRRIRRLSAETVQALSCAAFMGTEFELDTVAAVLGLPSSQLSAELEEALDEELLACTDSFAGRYCFPHDRVQQAAYALSDPGERAELHLAVGRILLRRRDAGEDIGLFDVVQALNAGRSALTEPDERARLRRLDLEAARIALGAAAYAPAHAFLSAALELLPGDAWEVDYAHALELHLEAASAAYLSHHRDTMRALVDVVLARARTELDKVAAHEVDINATFAAGELGPTLDRGLAVLRLLGVSLPAEPDQAQVIAGLGATQAALAESDDDTIRALPLASDPESQAIARILGTLFAPAYFARPSLLPLLAFELVRGSLVRGLTPESSYGFAVYGLVLCTVGDLSGGIAAGENALVLSERLGSARLRNLTRHVYLAHIQIWHKHWGTVRVPEEEVFRDGHDLGDLLFACFGRQMASTSGLFAHHELGALVASMKASEAAIRRLGPAIPLLLQELNLQLAVALREGPDDPDVFAGEYFDERTQVPELAATGDTSNLYVFSVLKSIQCYLLGDALAAADAAEANQAWLAGAASSLYTPMYLWIDAMAQLGAFDRLPEGRREAARARVDASRATLSAWAVVGPANLDHRLRLIDAEYARVFGDPRDAGERYPEAIALAAEHGWIGDQALGNELAGRLARSRGNDTVARAYLQEARHLYQRWGALAKVAQLDAAWPRLLATATGRPVGGTATATTTGRVEVDALAVVRASRAISQEIKLDGLVETLLRISLESSGARKGLLILVEDEQLIAYAEGISTTGITMRRLGVPAAEHGGCPTGILRYVQRAQQAVVLDDASSRGEFVGEPYVRAHNVRSVLCVPLELQGRLVALLYLENAEMASVFTRHRVELLRTLGAQAAISIENARLYSSLEEKVAARTRELAEARQRSEELLRNVLPEAIAEELKEHGQAQPVAYASTSVLFTDFVGFTRIAEAMSAQRLVAQLDRAFTAFDEVIARCRLEKLKTIGDAYMCAGGVPTPSLTHAADCVVAGLALLDYMAAVDAEGAPGWQLRVGIHSGPLVAGVIGTQRFAYDVWGETVNIASRMESSGLPGRVNVSEATWQATRPLFVWTDRGMVSAKNMGQVHMLIADGIRPELSVDGAGRVPNAAFADALAALLVEAG